nr:ribonuclease H-like domain-containing protein [Tanacetum cinerariifolium]
MTAPELNTTNDLLSKLLGTMGINYTTVTTNHTSTLIVVAYHTGPPYLVGPTAGPVLLGFPPKVHYSPTVLVGPNPTAPYNYNMMSAQSNVTPIGPPSQPTNITVQPGNIGLIALSGQATTIPHAFTTKTLRDFSNGTWNMDTGVSSHLNSSVNSLCKKFNTCMYPSISVGDGHSILITNTGHGDDVLRRLASNNVISCNNEKPLVLCHACQLGKRVRLPFVNSNNVVTSCFEIIHSNVKERQEKDKIGSKPDKNGKRGEAWKSQKQSQSIKQEKLKKIQVEGPKMQTPTKLLKKEERKGLLL